jgi:hypothetical protein
MKRMTELCRTRSYSRWKAPLTIVSTVMQCGRAPSNILVDKIIFWL